MKTRPTRLSKAEVRLALEFGNEVFVACEGRCAVCGYEGSFLERHHVIEMGKLKRLLSVKGSPCPPEILWDPDNGLLVCAEPAPNRCHNRHTLAVRRIPRAALRPENHAFAERHGLGFVVDAEYPEVAAA